MENYMQYDKEQIEAEILSKEKEHASLEKEIKSLEESKNLAKLIDQYLKNYYSELDMKHHIDRGQEPKVLNEINKYTDSVNSVLEKYNAHGGKTNCMNELKQICRLIQADTEKFYKNGLSKSSLEKLVKIMEKICSEGSKIGYFPQTYKSKVDSWKLISKDMPVDEFKKNQEKEDAARAEIIKKINKAKKELEDINNLIVEQKELLIKQDDDVKNLENQMETLIKNKPKLITDFETKKTELLQSFKDKETKSIEKYKKDIDQLKSFEKKENEIKAKYSKKIERLNIAVNSLREKIAKNTEIIHELIKDKSVKENELVNTFVLNFKRKYILNKEISEIQTSILYKQKELSTQEEELNTLLHDNSIKSEMEENLLSLKNEYDKRLTLIKSQMEEKLELLKNDYNNRSVRLDERKKASLASTDVKINKLKINIEKTIEKNKTAAVMIQNTINSYMIKYDEQNDVVSDLEKQLKDFHNNYIIKQFGQKILDAKTKRLKALSTDIEMLKKQLNSIDKQILKAQKEIELQAEKLKKEQIKKEQIKKEQEERRKRLEQEMLERENEQVELNSKSDLLIHISEIIDEIENNNSHPLLSEEICPFTDDGNRIITNGIVRKTYTQKLTNDDCKQYVFVFVDHKGNQISEQRLIQNKAIGSKTLTSFQLKSDDGFNNYNYYMLIINFDTGAVICAQKYKIKISFANDFDF